MADPILYGPAYSTFTRSVRLALAEKGVSYKHIEVDFMEGMPAEQVARQPFSKVPAFEHDGFPLYETCAIERYVDEAFSGPALQPEDVRRRARMMQIISIVDSYTYGPTVGLVEQRLFAPMMGGEPDEAAIEAAVPEVQNCMGTLEELLGDQTFMAGSKLSLADLHLAPVFFYFAATPDSGPILEDKPGLQHWWASMKTRESMTNTEPQFD